MLAAFAGVERYGTDYRWRLAGRLEGAAGKITVPNVLGVETREDSPGSLVFSYGGATHSLAAIGGATDEEWFVVFGDRTNGDTTYGGGRFVYVAGDPNSDRVVIDFNRAYNPPCAFTPFATCPLPPKGNKLPFAVVAGEKTYGDH